MFDWNDARFFLALQRAGSLSAAGRELKVNQSTVGRRITTLEGELGVRLFLQTPEGHKLTPAGERFVEHAERIEAEAIATTREISGQEARLTGTVRITAGDAHGVRFITPLLGEFHARYPGIDLELIADNRTLSLTKREADMAVRTPRPRESSLIVRRLPDLGVAMYAAATYVAARGRPQKLDFAGHDFVGFEDPYGSSEESAWLETIAKKGRIVFKTNSTMARLAAAQSGFGIALLPCYLGDPEEKLVRLSSPDQVRLHDMWLVMHKDLRYAARIRVCADFLVEALTARADILRGTKKRATGERDGAAAS
jgi:DNA-binding transcriptional LysR family regulator